MQEKSNWCWAASSVSMIQTKGLARSQTLHVGQAIYGLNYSLVTDAPNVTRTRSSVVGDFSMLYGISVALIGTLSFTTVQLKVNNNIPIYAGVDWNAGGAHAVVISGCDSSGEQLKIFDPSSGIEYCSRSTFLSNYRGLGNWSDSIFWS
jgi:hypothetical protein